MITVSDVSLSFTGQSLFKHVDLKFGEGNCYGVIGANGAGKSTFLRILSGDLEPSSGSVIIDAKQRMSVLKQDHYAFDSFQVLEAVIIGNKRLYDIMKEKDALYAKEDFTEEDGILASELEYEFSEMNGWDAETEVGKLVQGLGLPLDILYNEMSALTEREKVKILLAQALFGRPDILLLDEPTNGLDAVSIRWLEDFLADYPGIVIVVSHDRHFLNDVCTHIVDVDYNKIKIYVGNYDFWYESSLLVQRVLKDQNRKMEDKVKELQNFIARFSANKSKSRQATSRRKMLDKLTVDDMPASSRRYPFVGFVMDRELGKEVLSVDEISKTVDGVLVLDNISFRVGREDKIAFVGENEAGITALFQILAEELEPDSGSFKWGISTSRSYFPKDNTVFFEGNDQNLLQWLEQFAKDTTESYLRGFLGKMLFSGDDVLKSVSVLSGGEKVRCMLSRMMMVGSNVLLLDQPTNHLDLESITAVNNGLISFKSAVLFASYDHEFVQTVANRIIEVTPDGKLIDRLSSYEDYLEWKETQGKA